MHQCRNVYRKKSKNTLKHKFKKKKSKQLLTMENDTKRKYVHIN